MTIYDKATADRLYREAKKHASQALWRPLIDIAACNVGPATAEAVQWLDGQRNPLAALADQLEAAGAEVDRLARERARHENVSKALAGSHAALRAEVDGLRDGIEALIDQYVDGVVPSRKLRNLLLLTGGQPIAPTAAGKEE